MRANPFKGALTRRSASFCIETAAKANAAGLHDRLAMRRQTQQTRPHGTPRALSSTGAYSMGTTPVIAVEHNGVAALADTSKRCAV
jgi:hypothetical protein